MEQDLYGLQASGIDPEIAAQMLGLKRKRAVADALLQQSLSPLKADRVASGGIAVPISPWEGLAQMAKAYIGSKNLEDLDKQQSGLASANAAKVAEAMANYEKMRSGTPATSTPVPDAGPGDAVETSTNLNVAGKAGDPRAAIVNAMASPLLANNPMVKMDMQSMKPMVLGRTLVDATGKTLATDSTWADEQRAAQEARAAQSNAALEARAAEAEANRQNKQDMARLVASLRQPPQPPAPTMTEVLDPKDPTRMLRVDAKAYKGGSLGEAGVLGVSGKEPTAAKKAEQVDNGKNTVSDIVNTLRGHYAELSKAGGIVDPANGALSNVGAAIGSSGAGQFLGNMVGTENQSARNSIAQTRPLLLNAIKQATGMSAKQMDSNAELKMYLAAATDPKLDIKANMAALDSLDKLYGLGLGTKPNEASGQVTKRIASDAEYNALPSGAVFVGPDGKQRRKP